MQKKITRYTFLLFIMFAGLNYGCKKSNADPATSDSGFNLYTVEDDKKLGDQLEAEIASDPATYPVLDATQYPDAYAHINRIVNNILDGGKVEHRNDFNWSIHIIKDDSTLNAFCGPGGKIYVYTGIIKYLDNEDQLAGVLGHEIAHAAHRHVTQQLTKQYGISVLLDLALGKNQGQLTDIAASLLFLKFSRSDEADADEYSVVYLCPTTYKSDGAAGFFQKLISQGQGGKTPVFLSDHPSDDSRVQNIEKKATDLNCSGKDVDGQYSKFKGSLPQ